MPRYSRFARQLHDLHGTVVVDVGKIDPTTAISIQFAALLLFLAVTAFALGFFVVLAIFVFSAFAPHPLMDLDPNSIPVAVIIAGQVGGAG